MHPIGYISFILFITVVFILLVFGELLYFETYPPQITGDVDDIGQWMASFKRWASICIASTGLASLLWYILAQWGFKINRWEDTTGKRPIWFLLFLIPIIFTVVSCIYVKQTENSQLVNISVFLVEWITSILRNHPPTFTFCL